MGNIGEVNYKSFNAQKTEIREQTERSINSLFNKGIINSQQKTNLLGMYLSGNVDFGDDGLTEEEALEFTQESYNEIENNIKKTGDSAGEKTMYIVQTGDTPKIIAEKLGLKGDEATRFIKDLIITVKREGMYNKYGLRVGDMIQLNGDFKNKLEELKAKGEYKDSTEEINNEYKRVRKEQEENRKRETPSLSEDDETPPQTTSPSGNVRPISPERRTRRRGGTAQTGPTEAQKTSAKKVYDEAINIVKELGQRPSPNNPVLNRITPQNVVFVMKMYYDTYHKHLSRALTECGDKNGTVVYNKLCYNLCARAKQLGISGIYFGDAQKCLKNTAKLFGWLNMAYPKILEGEKKNNPAFVSNADYEVSRKKTEYEDTSKIKNDSDKIARELNEALHDSFSGNLREKARKIWDNKDNSITKSILNKINPSNVAFVIQTYKKEYNKSLAKDINGEWIGLSIKDIKENLCAKLVLQANKLNISCSGYSNINDIETLEKWMDDLSVKIVRKMDGNSSALPSDSTKESITERPGGGKIKTITGGNMFVEAGLNKVVEEYDKNGTKLQAKYYYKDGKEVLEIYNKNEKTGEVELKERKLIKHGSTKKPANTNITEPVPMQIKMPSNANDNAKKFARALETNKERLMKLLNIDNDTYNKLARLAMAIAEQETNFGNPATFSAGNGKKIIAGIDTIAGIRNKGIIGGNYSFGMTQIKLGLWLDPQKEPELYNIFTKHLNITSGCDLFDAENSAIATMAILATINKRVQNPKVQDSIEAANGRVISNEGWEMNHSTGILEKTYRTKPYVNKVTDEDAICYYWNNGGGAIRRGTADPAGNSYTNNIRKYIKKYSVKESPADRQEAIQKSKNKKTTGSQKFTPMDNNGSIGSIIFMPKMYSNKPVNKADEIQILKNALSKNSKIKPEDKQELIKAVEHGELAFEFGLTPNEAASLTQSDVDKLLKHLKTLKQQIESQSNVKFSDGISEEEAKTLGTKFKKFIRQSEYNFKRDYLNSKSKRVTLSDNNANAVSLNNNTMQVSTADTRKGFAGNISDKGVNTSGTSAASATLARTAQRTSTNMTQAAKNKGKQPGGFCMTGIRNTLRAAGIDDSDLKESVPRTAVNFFLRHPDMFEEVKWINLGNGKGRQINSTDLPKLPAGYIVVWIPDPKFPKKEGHISITNGNGQAYADETDNLDWGGYSGKDWTGNDASGKGEHGTFRVFRLTDKWKVGPDGKLIFNN